MTTSHVYQIFIRATPQQVWTAITESDWTERYFHRSRFDAPLQPGRPYATHQAGTDRALVDGVIEELVPPTDDTPGRLVQTWHVLYDAALTEEQPGRVEWTVEPAGDGLTRVRLVHGDLALSPLTWRTVKDGWAWILGALKSVLETGESLPRWSTEPDEPSAEVIAGDWHRRQGVEANNATWDLLESGAIADAVLSAYAAAYHWQRATGRTPVNSARADYLISRAELAAGHPATALEAADRCLATCREHGYGDFDLAYAYEARTRALAALGRAEEAAADLAGALAVEISEEEDRAIFAADVADLIQHVRALPRHEDAATTDQGSSGSPRRPSDA